MILSSVRHLFQKFTPTSACGRVPIRSLRTLICMQPMSISTLMGTMVLVNNKCSGIRLFCSVCIAVCEQHGGPCSSSMRWTSVAVIGGFRIWSCVIFLRSRLIWLPSVSVLWPCNRPVPTVGCSVEVVVGGPVAMVVTGSNLVGREKKFQLCNGVNVVCLPRLINLE